MVFRRTGENRWGGGDFGNNKTGNTVKREFAHRERRREMGQWRGNQVKRVLLKKKSVGIRGGVIKQKEEACQRRATNR